MPKIDPELERQRLIAFYAGQMDGELEKVAGQAYELTPVAREQLRAELAKRGLTPKFIQEAPFLAKRVAVPEPGDPPPPEPPPEVMETEDGELEHRERVTIRRFRDLPEALLAQGLLNSAGIDAVLADDNMVRLDWFWSNMIGGVRLRVDPENVDAANEILDQPIPESFDATGTGEYQLPSCPKCQSLDVTFRELNQPASFLPAFLIAPIPIHRRAWRCRACNVEWEDDEAEGGESLRP
jgi:Putative prokaryotic signal transducing protein